MEASEPDTIFTNKRACQVSHVLPAADNGALLLDHKADSVLHRFAHFLLIFAELELLEELHRLCHMLDHVI